MCFSFSCVKKRISDHKRAIFVIGGWYTSDTYSNACLLQFGIIALHDSRLFNIRTQIPLSIIIVNDSQKWNDKNYLLGLFSSISTFVKSVMFWGKEVGEKQWRKKDTHFSVRDFHQAKNKEKRKEKNKEIFSPIIGSFFCLICTGVCDSLIDSSACLLMSSFGRKTNQEKSYTNLNENILTYVHKRTDLLTCIVWDINKASSRLSDDTLNGLWMVNCEEKKEHWIIIKIELHKATNDANRGGRKETFYSISCASTNNQRKVHK